MPFSGHFANNISKTDMITSNLIKKKKRKTKTPYINYRGAVITFSVSQVCSLPRSVRQICLTASAIRVLLLCRTVFDKVSSLVREAGTVGEASLAENQFTRMLILGSKAVYAILLNQLNSFFPCATTELREAVAINPENGIVSLFFLQ